jgi:hypothetical protein
MVEARVEYEECVGQDLGEWDSLTGRRVEWEARTVLHGGVRGGGDAVGVPGGDCRLLQNR